MNQPLGFIDAFRAFAALWVLVAHCLIWGGWSPPFPIPAPKIAVDLFMLISGFLMALNATSRDAMEPLSTRSARLRFWLRRYFRLAPAYYLALVLAASFSTSYVDGYRALRDVNPAPWSGVAYDPLAVDFSSTSLLIHASFLFGLHPTLASSTALPDWSLSLEMQFYLVFPFLWLFAQRVGPIRATVLLTATAWGLAIAVDQFADYREPALLAFKLRYFLAGMLAFHALHASGWRRVSLSAVVILLCGLEPSYGRQVVLLPLLASFMLAAGMLEQRGSLPRCAQRAFTSAPVRFASNVSYSVYLFHGFWLSTAGWLFNDRALTGGWRFAAIAALVIPGAYLTGWAVHRLVETPGIALGRRLITRLGERSLPGHHRLEPIGRLPAQAAVATDRLRPPVPGD